MGMQMKLTLAFVFIGLLSCSLVGSVDYYMVKRDFHQASKAHALKDFQENFQDYVKKYGGLEDALAAEPLDLFVKQNHLLPTPTQPSGADVGDSPAPPVNRWPNQPFMYLVLDAKGIVLQDAGGYKAGEKVPQSVIDEATPVTVEDEVVAFASPIGDEALTPLDMRYLSAVKHALINGTLVALGVSLVLGLVFGKALSRAVVNLTNAIRMMQDNREEFYRVEVSSNDELGELTEAYNEMNQELAEAYREMRELAIQDSLTGLYNRRHFDEQSRQSFATAIRYGQPLSVMIGDLDHFKQINDAYSHEMGDLVLQKVAEIIEGTTRKSDVVARYGGEEFVILFVNTDRDRAAVSCENVRRAIEAYPWNEFHQDLSVTMSMGLCDNTDLGSVPSMLSQADEFLYVAKSTGRNRLAYQVD